MVRTTAVLLAARPRLPTPGLVLATAPVSGLGLGSYVSDLALLFGGWSHRSKTEYRADSLKPDCIII